MEQPPFIVNHIQERVLFQDIEYVVPKIQRAIDNHYSIDDIVEKQLRFYEWSGKYFINSTISIAVWNKSKYLVDGQHRMVAYKLLYDKYPEREILVSIDYFWCQNEPDIDEVYKYVNISKPNDITIMTIEECKILAELKAYLEANYKPFIKTGTKKDNMPVNVRQPHINMSKLAAFISEKKILSRAGITSGKEFIEELKILNDFYAKTSNEKYKEWGIGDIEKIKTLINKKNHDKCLYLGIYNCLEWLTFMADHLAFNKPYEDMNHISSTAKVVVTTDLRKKVWGIDSMRGICYVCSANIEYTGFECGHIIPRSLGGSTTLDNLKPICRGCNSDMGIMNLEDYRKMHILQNKIS